jgi:hypothetical protein
VNLAQSAETATRGRRQGSADKFVHNEGLAAWERVFIVDAALAGVNGARRNILWLSGHEPKSRGW